MGSDSLTVIFDPFNPLRITLLRLRLFLPLRQHPISSVAHSLALSILLYQRSHPSPSTFTNENPLHSKNWTLPLRLRPLLAVHPARLHLPRSLPPTLLHPLRQLPQLKHVHTYPQPRSQLSLVDPSSLPSLASSAASSSLSHSFRNSHHRSQRELGEQSRGGGIMFSLRLDENSGLEY